MTPDPPDVPRGRGTELVARWAVLAATALVALTAGACSSSPGAGTAPSTIAPGSPWAGPFVAATLPAPVNSLTEVDCATAATCYAVGSTVGGAGAPNGAAIVATTDGGRSWTAQSVPPTAGYLSGISCSDQRTCVAVGEATQSSNGQGVILATDDGGRSWQPRAVPTGFLDITAVACGSDRRCTAIGDLAGGAAALTLSSTGAAWVERGTLPAGVSGATAVSCPSDTDCWVAAHRMPDPGHVSGIVAFSTDGGAVWSTATTPSGIGYLNGISCPTSGFSPAPAGNTSSPAAGNTSSPTESIPGSSTTGTGPAGLAGVFCTAVGTTADTLDTSRSGRGVVLTTDDGGGTWAQRAVPASSASLMDVSCTGTDSCMMVGSTVASAPQAGSLILTGPASSPWKAAVALGAPQPLTGVSCVSQASCVAVGESISEHLANG